MFLLRRRSRRPFSFTSATWRSFLSRRLNRYEAEIVTPSSGTLIDRGETDVHVETILGLGAGGSGGLFENADVASFSETFFSDLARGVLPTTKAQCKNGGYEQLGFKNQGECLKAVQKPPS